MMNRMSCFHLVNPVDLVKTSLNNTEFFMFNRLKNLFSGLSYAFQYGGTIRNVTTAWANFPGLNEDSTALRQWLRPLVTDAATLHADFGQ